MVKEKKNSQIEISLCRLQSFKQFHTYVMISLKPFVQIIESKMEKSFITKIWDNKFTYLGTTTFLRPEFILRYSPTLHTEVQSKDQYF